LKFITEASTKYEDILKRQAFSTVSLDIFIRSEAAEREYLGRISHGFFAFHALGVFGEAAIERLKHAKRYYMVSRFKCTDPSIGFGCSY